MRDFYDRHYMDFPFFQLRQLYWKIHHFIWPKNRWFTDLALKAPQDESDLIKSAIFAGLIHFVEHSRGLDRLIDTIESFNDLSYFAGDEVRQAERIRETKKAYRELKAAYRWAIIRDQEHERIYSDFDSSNDTITTESVMDTRNAEIRFYEMDQFAMIDIVKNIEYLWT